MTKKMRPGRAVFTLRNHGIARPGDIDKAVGAVARDLGVRARRKRLDYFGEVPKPYSAAHVADSLAAWAWMCDVAGWDLANGGEAMFLTIFDEAYFAD